MSRRKWADDEIAAVIELSESCSPAQLAAYLNRSIASVGDKQREIGVGPRQSQRFNPWRVPASGILIARSCVRCGKLRGAIAFGHNNGGKNRSTWCKPCVSDYTRNRNKKGAATSALNAATKAVAYNEGKWYTDDEEAVVRDVDKTELEVARELGRSWKAICEKRSRMKVGRWGQNKRVRKNYNEWHINFPRDHKVIEEVFAELGRPVPEDLYEWSDEDLAVSA